MSNAKPAARSRAARRSSESPQQSGANLQPLCVAVAGFAPSVKARGRRPRDFESRDERRSRGGVLNLRLLSSVVPERGRNRSTFGRGPARQESEDIAHMGRWVALQRSGDLHRADRRRPSVRYCGLTV